jgi:peptide/nickel transport system substrate-binding protein
MNDDMVTSRRTRGAFVRQLGALGLGVAAMPLAQACAPAPAAQEPTPARAATPGTGATQAPATPRSGGRLRVAHNIDVNPREPHLFLGGNTPILRAVWDTLTYFDENVRVQPLLAERWAWSDEFRTLTLSLRKGVKFHSGRDFTSEDVEFNLQRVLDPAVGSQARAAASRIQEIGRPDASTVVLRFDSAFPTVFDMFEQLVIVDRETVGQSGEGKVIGTGPFLWREWVPNTKLTLEKNPSYWQSGVPLVDRIELTIISDAQAMVVQLEAGQQDVVINPSAQDFVRLRQNTSFQAVALEAAGSPWYVAADVTVPPLDKKEVRQAISHAIDRQRFVQTVLNGVGRATLLPWAKGSPAYDATLDQSVKYDLDRAKALLTQAGVGGGFEIPVTYNSQRVAVIGKLIEILQADLAKIGVRLNVQVQENTVFQQNLNNRTMKGLFSHGHGGANLSPVTLFVQAFPFRKDNASGFKSAEYDRLIDAMVAETNEQRLKQLYTDMDRLLIDEAFVMEVAFAPTLHIARAAVKGVQQSPTAIWELNRVSVG